MRILLFLVILANLLFFMAHQGYLGKIVPDGHEPERMNQQIQPDRLKLLTSQQFDALTVKPLPADAQAPLPSADALLASLQGKVCVEFGGFAGGELQRIEEILAAQKSGDRVTVRKSDEQTNWAVYIPAFKTKPEAEKKAQELRNLGVNDFFIIQDNGDFQYAISLGVFKTEDGAKNHLAVLNRKGVHSARIGMRNVILNKTYFQFRALDADLLNKLVALKQDFPNQELIDCPAAAPKEAKR